jgi:hypothetical protein
MATNRFCSVCENGIKLYSNYVLHHQSGATSRKTTVTRHGIAKATGHYQQTGTGKKQPGIGKCHLKLPKRDCHDGKSITLLNLQLSSIGRLCRDPILRGIRSGTSNPVVSAGYLNSAGTCELLCI